jgi:hypothetical protein
MMTEQQSSYSADETVQRAEDLYEQRLRPLVKAQYRGQYIAIDIESGEYEIGENYHAAAHTLLDRQPNAAIGVLRIGYPAVGRIGERVKTVPS